MKPELVNGIDVYELVFVSKMGFYITCFNSVTIYQVSVLQYRY